MPSYGETVVFARAEFLKEFAAAYRDIIRYQTGLFSELAEQYFTQKVVVSERAVQDVIEQYGSIEQFDAMIEAAREKVLPQVESFASQRLQQIIDEYGSVSAFNAVSILEIQQDVLGEFDGIIGTALKKESNIARNLALRDLKDALVFGGERFALSEFRAVMETWQDEALARGQRAVVQVDGDIARMVWRSSGVTAIQWNTSGDNCDACDNLSGRIVGIESGDAFLSQGQNTQEDLQEGQSKTQGKIWAGSDVLHPPLHSGCDCYITPVSGFRSKEYDMGKEKRMGGEIGAETRDGDNPDDMIVYGYAAVFNSRTEIRKGQFEEISPGSFTRTLAEGADVRLNFNHDPNQVLARTKNGSLTLWEDDHGLAYRAELNPKDSQAESIYQKIKRKDVSGSSFMFNIEKESVRDVEGGRLFIIEDAELFDVGPVTYPAYTSATVSARTASRRCKCQDKQEESGNQRASPSVVATRNRKRVDQLRQLKLKKKEEK
jgi:HK97 family phage prohead protease